MRIRPYRTVDNVIDGVVVTFINITELKQLRPGCRKTLAAHEAPPSRTGPGQLRALAERAAAALPQPAADADSDQLKHWHELQVSQIELDMQHQALRAAARTR